MNTNYLTGCLLAGALMMPFAGYGAPEIKQQGAVTFVSGGIHLTEEEEMKALAPGYSVELLFAAHGARPPDRYLAGIPVTIKDSSGKVVLETESQGPFLLAKLPPGKYSVSADNDGNVIKRNIQVRGGKTQRFSFVWKQAVDVCVDNFECNEPARKAVSSK